MSSGQSLPRVHQDRPTNQECYGKNFPSLSLCQCMKIPTTNLMQTEPEETISRRRGACIINFACLCSNISQGSFRDGFHAVKVSIAGLCSLWFFIHQARRREDVFET